MKSTTFGFMFYKTVSCAWYVVGGNEAQRGGRRVDDDSRSGGVVSCGAFNTGLALVLLHFKGFE